MDKATGKKIPKIILKSLLWILGSILGIILLFLIFIQFPAPQKYLTEKITAYISKKTNSKVSLEKITILFPKDVSLTNLYVEDLHQDTLLYVRSLKVNLNLWDLLSQKLELKDIYIDGLKAHVFREFPDTTFNFSFIPSAFTSNDTAPEPTEEDTKTKFQFSIKKVHLTDIDISYHDTLSGIMADVKLGEFKTVFDTFNLTENKIYIQSFELKKTIASVVQHASLVKDTKTTESSSFDLSLKAGNLSNIKATYINKDSYQDLRADIGNLDIEAKKIDLLKEKLELEKITLSQSAIVYTLYKPVADTLEKKENSLTTAKKGGTSNWIIDLQQLSLSNNSFAYDNKNETKLLQGMDFNHLLLRNIQINSQDIHFGPDKIQLTLNDLRLQEERGFNLKKFKGRITYDDKHIELDKLDIQTDKSRIGNYLGIRFNSIQSIKDSLGYLQTKIELKNTVVSLSDILLFQPDLISNPQLKFDRNMVVHLNCKINGRIDDLFINQFELSTLTHTTIEIKGRLQNVRSPKQMYADVQLLKLTSGKNDINEILDTSIIPQSIMIPELISVKGDFKGYTQNFDGAAFVTTSFGDAAVTVKMDPVKGNEEQSYSIKFTTDRFDLGKLLNDPELLGPITMNTAIDGRGLSDTTLSAKLNTTIEEAVFKKYRYKNLVIEGLINKKSFDGTANIKDSNVVFNYSGIIDLDSVNPKYNFVFDLKAADLKALNFTEENLRISAVFQSDLKKEQTENMTGTASIKNIVFIKNEDKYKVDSLTLVSEYKENIAAISLNSPIFDAHLNGNITLNELPQAIKKHFSYYFDFQQKDTLTPSKPERFDFDFNLKDPTLLTEGLIPKLEKLTPFSIRGMYDSKAKNIKMDLDLPQLVYSQIIIDSLKINVNSTTDVFTTQINIAEISNPTIKLENLFFKSDLAHNNIHFLLNTAKDDSTKMLQIAGNLKSIDHTFQLKLDPTLILNNSYWAVDTSNYLSFGQAGLIANNLIIKQETQTISINSQEKKEQAPLEIKFSDFKLETLSKIIENENELISGTINGNAILKKQHAISTFTSDLEIKGLVFNKIPTGDLRLIANNNENPQKYNVKLNITGNENDIQLNGAYLAETKEPRLDFLLAIHSLNLKTVEPYTFGQVTQMSGKLEGKMIIKGSPSAPDLTGTLSFNSCAFRPKVVDTYLRAENEKISFESKKVRFNSFILIDSLNNKAVVDGYVSIEDFKSIPFDIRLKTDNFLALNTTEKSNPLYFGTIYLDSDIKLKGTSTHPLIDAKIGLNKGTVITYVKPENTSGKNDIKGIVEFIDTLELGKSIMVREKGNEVSETKGLSVNATINFDKDAELKMLVDRVSGDSLFIKGSGQLEFSMDEGGKMNLIGKYRINDGGYHLTLNDFIKKNFTVAKGSSVTWSGDVTDPYVDIKAIYKIKASPVDLVENELTGADQMEKNKYRTLMNFLVYLKMTGFVSTPEISFDIQQPADERGALNGAVNAKLNELRADESQLNKQVFALLALNRFIGEDPLESGGAGGLSSTSRASASRILTQQLSNLSEKYVKGVDLNLGVNSYEDYSSGEQTGRTQLQLGVSKTLLNDRVTVQVGGNVDVEGEKAKQNNASDVAGNISIEYKLTEDGRYKLKGFRENEYENPIEGELTKTGFGIIYRRNYNKFKELFSKPKPRKKVDD